MAGDRVGQAESMSNTAAALAATGDWAGASGQVGPRVQDSKGTGWDLRTVGDAHRYLTSSPISDYSAEVGLAKFRTSIFLDFFLINHCFRFD